MLTSVDHGRLAQAQAKFEPVAQVLDRLAKDIEKEHGPSAVLEQRSPMRPTAQNVFAVRYSLWHADEARFALIFLVTGENADLLLVRAQERTSLQDNRSDPGRVDQRVYRLDEIEEIKDVIQEKIVSHLRRRGED